MPDEKNTYRMIDRETAWLAFSARVLQEAEDPTVPLFERFFFCGIFSSNLDEYFRVRVASLRSLLRLGQADIDTLGISPHRLLHEIHRIVLAQQERYGAILAGLVRELAAAGIAVVGADEVASAHDAFLRDFFREEVVPLLDAVPLDGDGGTPFLRNHQVYLAVELWEGDAALLTSWTPSYYVVRVPSDVLPRFVTLPSRGDVREVMFLDDVIRYNLGSLFPGREVGRAYAVKLTRDAELYIEDEFEGDMVEAIRTSLGKRETGVPSRFLYDMRAP
ncbi:MAG TPA: hypothetical protein VJ997_06615, partial [Longimicrobiales bacterium]|nr:hypothetical protein [Longimicrobiales bacterium]